MRSATRALTEPGVERLRRAPAPVRNVINSAGKPLESRARGWMEARFVHDFSNIRVHADGAAAASARDVGAAAYSVGEHLVFGAGRYRPESPTGWPLIAHELSHAMQPRGSTAQPAEAPPIADVMTGNESAAREAAGLTFTNGRIPVAAPSLPIVALHRAPSTLADVPEKERLTLKAAETAVTVPPDEIKDVFATRGDRTSYDPGGETVFGPGIDKKLHQGLTSVSGYITHQTNALPLNTTINVALDLSKVGGAHSIYRFTWFKHTEGKKSGNVMIVELVGPAVAVATVSTVPSGSFKVGGETFKIAGKWSNNEFAQLQHALGMLGANALKEASGMTFRRTAGQGARAEAGHYDVATDTVVVYDDTFDESALRFGTARRTARNILHEVGHGIDLRVVEKAWKTFSAGGQTAAGRTTLLAARSPSGSRYIQKPGGGDYVADLNMKAPKEGAFRTAAAADKMKLETSKRNVAAGSPAGLKGGVTDYSDVDFQEMFAESYSLYMLDPGLLRLLRPKTYEYFVSRYSSP